VSGNTEYQTSTSDSQKNSQFDLNCWGFFTDNLIIGLQASDGSMTGSLANGQGWQNHGSRTTLTYYSVDGSPGTSKMTVDENETVVGVGRKYSLLVGQNANLILDNDTGRYRTGPKMWGNVFFSSQCDQFIETAVRDNGTCDLAICDGESGRQLTHTSIIPPEHLSVKIGMVTLGSRLCAVGIGDETRIYDRALKLVKSIPVAGGFYEFSPDDGKLAITTNDGQVEIVDLKSDASPLVVPCRCNVLAVDWKRSLLIAEVIGNTTPAVVDWAGNKIQDLQDWKGLTHRARFNSDFSALAVVTMQEQVDEDRGHRTSSQIDFVCRLYRGL
jgi:hypothetical protein